MTPAEMLPLLEAWAKRQRELTKQMDALAAPFGNSFDGPFYNAVWGAWNDYTATLERLIGDDEHWLSWFESDNNMGKRAHQVHSSGGRSMRVRTLKQLASIIAEQSGERV